MKQVKLTETAQIPDENHDGDGEPQSATNYAGAILDLGDKLADRLVAEGKAVLHIAPPKADDAPAGETAAAVVRTFDSQE